MDYLKIVLDGYCNPIDRKMLKDYFVREMKKSEKEYYTPAVFYEGCKDVINQLYGNIKQQKQNELIRVINAIDNAKNTDELAKLHEIKEQVKNTYYMVPLYQLTNGRYNSRLGIDEIMYIEKALDISRKFTILEEKKRELNNLKEIINTQSNKPTGTTLNTNLSNPRIDELYRYLSEEKFINTTPEMWRYWFTKQSLQAGKKPVKIQWLKAGSILSNVVMLICGNFTNHTENAMKEAFKLSSGTKFQKLTNSRNDRSKEPYRRIYEIKEHAETKLQS